MSSTEIYTVSKSGDVELRAEVKNSFRGAFHVWERMGKLYLGHFSLTDLRPVWDLWKDGSVRRSNRIVMAATFDRVMVKRENLKQLCRALLSFASCDVEGLGSQHEQMLILKKLIDDDSIVAVCWNQTSVNASMWEICTDDDCLPYNIHRNDDHWFLFDELQEGEQR